MRVDGDSEGFGGGVRFLVFGVAASSDPAEVRSSCLCHEFLCPLIPAFSGCGGCHCQPCFSNFRSDSLGLPSGFSSNVFGDSRGFWVAVEKWGWHFCLLVSFPVCGDQASRLLYVHYVHHLK